jgi:ferredoxin
MIMAGASAIQIYSAAHMVGIKAHSFINWFVSEFSAWLETHKYNKISQIRGILLPQLARHTQMDVRVPSYNSNLCTQCKACVGICLEGAVIANNGKIVVNSKKCTGCGACVSSCPGKALK